MGKQKVKKMAAKKFQDAAESYGVASVEVEEWRGPEVDGLVRFTDGRWFHEFGTSYGWPAPDGYPEFEESLRDVDFEAVPERVLEIGLEYVRCPDDCVLHGPVKLVWEATISELKPTEMHQRRGANIWRS